jgi:hypothetical protein
VPPSLQDIFHFYMASLQSQSTPSSNSFGHPTYVKSGLVA